MASPMKYLRSPLLGAPSHNRTILGFFKGALLPPVNAPLIQPTPGHAAASRRALHASCRTHGPAAQPAAGIGWQQAGIRSPIILPLFGPLVGRTQQNNPPYSRGLRQKLENLCRECGAASVMGTWHGSAVAR